MEAFAEMNLWIMLLEGQMFSLVFFFVGENFLMYVSLLREKCCGIFKGKL